MATPRRLRFVHRLVLSTDAELSDLTPEEIVEDILDSVTVPITASGDEISRAVGDGGDDLDWIE